MPGGGEGKPIENIREKTWEESQRTTLSDNGFVHWLTTHQTILLPRMHPKNRLDKVLPHRPLQQQRIHSVRTKKLRENLLKPCKVRPHLSLRSKPNYSTNPYVLTEAPSLP